MNDEARVAELRKLFPVIEHWTYLYNGSIHPCPRPVSEAMMTAFLRFARTGDPGWPPYTLPARPTRIFDSAPHMENDPRRAERELFARIPYIQPGT